MPELSEMPNDLVASLRDDPQAAVAFVATEHFDLASARGATNSETNGRASIFLGSVSAGLVALAFAAQSSHTATIAGVIAFAFAVLLHQWYQVTVRNRAMRAPTADAKGLSPTPDAD